MGSKKTFGAGRFSLDTLASRPGTAISLNPGLRVIQAKQGGGGGGAEGPRQQRGGADAPPPPPERGRTRPNGPALITAAPSALWG